MGACYVPTFESLFPFSDLLKKSLKCTHFSAVNHAKKTVFLEFKYLGASVLQGWTKWLDINYNEQMLGKKANFYFYLISKENRHCLLFD